MSNVTIKGFKMPSEADKLKCFICGRIIMERYYSLSTVKCETSGMKVTEVLGQLIGELFYVVVSDSDVICRCCTSLLNTYDRLECLRAQLSSVIRSNLNENYLSKQVANHLEFDLAHLGQSISPSCPFSELELSQELLSGKPSPADSVSFIPTASVEPNVVKLEPRSIIETAFETLQYDLSELNHKEPCFSEPITPFSISQVNFTEGDIQNQINTLTDIETQYIHDQLTLPCSFGHLETDLFSKADSSETTSNSYPLACNIPPDGESFKMANKINPLEESFSDGDHIADQDSAENFYVQIVSESGETSRSVLTLDSDSAQVLKHKWEA
ncbi:unnamed protein product [Bemisia tabaci]|uniref:Uncharacterized protein n=1 Tax=Bemisia tabaci TaxID=7038 RepID=A0A9P0CBU2_BEMTA|nr:unnamed protein product [Bemisia tabaci]